jgi:hypothetical protein
MFGGPMGMGGQQACFNLIKWKLKCKGTGKAYGLTQCRA